MKGFVITMKGHALSERGAESLIETAKKVKELDIAVHEATVPDTIWQHSIEVFGYKVPWRWPKSPHEETLDFSTGIHKTYYRATDQNKVIACAISHARLWKKCVDLQEPIAIFEHDALIKKPIPFSKLLEKKWGALSLNDPRGCTRKASMYHFKLSKCDPEELVHKIPDLEDERPFANGLPGNGSYLIRPKTAKKALEKIHEVGLWPNDALLCKQLFPSIKAAYPFYTLISSFGSTTTG